LRLQQRLKGHHYVLLDAGVAEHNNDLDRIFDRRLMWGTRLAYYYNSGIVGPLGVSLGWNNHTHRLNLLVSLGYDF